MPETLDSFVAVIDAAFDAADEQIDIEDEEPTSLVEYLACAGRRRPSRNDEPRASRR